MFRRLFTRLCQLPGILLSIFLMGVAAFYVSGKDPFMVMVFIFLLVVALCITFGIGAFIKFIYYKERPHPQKFTNWIGKIDASSFPSIHTAYATIFMLGCLLLAYIGYGDQVLLDTEFYVENKLLAIFIAIIGIIFYVLIARSRIVLKKHFFIDILFGTLLGAGVTVLVAWQIDTILSLLDYMPIVG